MEIIIDRNKLYDEIWEQSLHKTAIKYKISDSEIKKICMELDIPLPDKSYWGKFYFGANKPNKEKLSKSDANIYTFKVNDKKSRINSNFANDNGHYSNYLSNLDDKYKNEILNILKKFDINLITTKHQILSNIKKVHSNKLAEIRKKSYYVDKTETSEEIQKRICFIMNVIATMLERSSFSIRALDTSYENRFIISYDNIKIYLRIKEKNNRIFVPDDSPFSWNGKKMELIPSGVIEIAINEHDNYDSYFAKTWRDGKKIKLESKSNEIILGIIDYTIKVKNENIQKEIRQRELEKQKTINDEKRLIQKQELEKLKKLEDDSNQYYRAYKIRKYIDAYENNANLTEEDFEYIKWAKAKADWIDPLIQKQDKILDEKIY